MFGKKKHKVLIWSVIISILVNSCNVQKNTEIEGYSIQGETQGTTYQIIIAEEELNFSKTEIDSVLSVFDLSLSTYIPESIISQINNCESNLVLSDPSGFFKNCYHASVEVYINTEGAFDPSVYPLVEGWGFMKKMESPLNQIEVDSLQSLMGFNDTSVYSIEFEKDDIRFKKRKHGFKLDFNAIAQGYAVDVLADFVRNRGHENFYVEIGGELVVAGKNRSGEKWVIGIDKPKDTKGRELEDIIEVTNTAIATSGNYRNYYVVDGKKYSHTLDPKTGYPVQHHLLSATVLANDATIADAYATAFMVIGVEQTKEFLAKNKNLNLKVVLLYNNNNGEIEQYSTL